MRIVKCEKIFLSLNEMDTWTNFTQILEALERGSENPDIKELVLETKGCLCALWDVE